MRRESGAVKAIFCMVVILWLGGFSLAEPIKNSPVGIDAVEPVRDFVRAHGDLEIAARAAGTPPASTMLNSPTVTIYSPKGEVLYSQGSATPEEINTNLSTLRDFPLSVKDLKPIPNVPPLGSMLGIVPEFKEKSDRILHDGHYVIYLVSIADSNMVLRTEHELIRIRTAADNTNVDTLLVRMKLPKK